MQKRKKIQKEKESSHGRQKRDKIVPTDWGGEEGGAVGKRKKEKTAFTKTVRRRVPAVFI